MSNPYRASQGQGEEGGPCPRCTDVPLYVLRNTDTSVLACRACGGVFVERDELMRMIDGDAGDVRALAENATADAPGRPRTQPPVLACPICDGTMAALTAPAAACVIDVCSDHGAWFDRWEARLVIESLREPSVARALAAALQLE